jgi:hypothetical protein
VARDERVRTIAERVDDRAHETVGRDFGDERTALAAEQREQACGVRADLLERDRALALGRVLAADGDQTAQIRPACAVLREQHERRALARRPWRIRGFRPPRSPLAALFDPERSQCERFLRCQRDLRAEHELQPELARLDVRAHHAVHAVAIGQGQRRQSEPLRFLDEFLGPTRALEERVVALAPQRGAHDTHPCRNQRRRGRS